MIYFFSFFYSLSRSWKRKKENQAMRSFSRIAPRGAAFPIAARPLRRFAASGVANLAVRNRRDATGLGRTPLRPRPLIGPAALAAGDDGVASPTSTPACTSALVDALLASVADASADRGASMSASERAATDALFDQLVAAAAAEREKENGEGKGQARTSSSSPLDSPFLLGDFDVAYVSTGRQQRGQPAGGRFRSRVGRALFRTVAVCQSIFVGGDESGDRSGDGSGGSEKGGEKPQLLVTNKVAFRLAGVLEGSIGLRGRVTRSFPSSDWKRAEEKERSGGDGSKEDEEESEEEKGHRAVTDAVRVDFDRAVLSFLPNSEWFRLFLRIGRPSWVALATPYGEKKFGVFVVFCFCFFFFFGVEVPRSTVSKLTKKRKKSTKKTQKKKVDERVRLGVGSLGSKFIFVRGGEAERQDMRRVGLLTKRGGRSGGGSKEEQQQTGPALP